MAFAFQAGNSDIRCKLLGVYIFLTGIFWFGSNRPKEKIVVKKKKKKSQLDPGPGLTSPVALFKLKKPALGSAVLWEVVVGRSWLGHLNQAAKEANTVQLSQRGPIWSLWAQLVPAGLASPNAQKASPKLRWQHIWSSVCLPFKL